MKSKRMYLLMALLVMLVLIAVGCGSSTTSSDSSQTQTTQQTAPPVKTNPVKLVSLADQVKQTPHYKMFGAMVATGPEGTKAAHYGDSCISCHSAVKMVDDKNAKLADFFPGGKYQGQTEGITCRVCHTLGGSEGISLKNQGWDTCMVCHTGTPKLGSEVHHPQAEMIKGVGVGDVPDTPSYKYKKMKDDFSCTDCHVTNNLKHDFMVPGVTATHDGVNRTGTTIDYTKFKEVFNQQKCVTCHSNPDGIVEKVKKNQEEITKKIEELKPIYDEWSKKVATMDKNDPKVKAFQEGSTYLTYVEADSSKGAHNYEFAKALLEKAQAKYGELK